MPSLAAEVAELAGQVERLQFRTALAYDADGRPSFDGGISVGDGSGGSTPVGGTSRLAAPGAPTVTPGSYLDRVFADVEWEAVPAAVSYEVIARHVPSGALDPRTPTSTSVRFTDLQPNTQYGFRVYAVDQLGRASDPSDETIVDVGQDTTDPSAVTGLTVAATFRSLISRWDDAVDADVAGGRGWYHLETQRRDGSNWVAHSTDRTSATLATTTDLQVDTRYRQRIRAIDSSSNVGPWSAWREATTGQISTGDLADGAVRGPKILAGSIAADDAVFAAAAIVDADIASLSADKLEANSGDFSWLQADSALFERVFIGFGGSIQIDGFDDAGLSLDEGGLRLFDRDGVQTVRFNGLSGDAEFRGTIVGSTFFTSNAVGDLRIEPSSIRMWPREDGDLVAGVSSAIEPYFSGSYTTATNFNYFSGVRIGLAQSGAVENGEINLRIGSRQQDLGGGDPLGRFGELRAELEGGPLYVPFLHAERGVQTDEILTSFGSQSAPPYTFSGATGTGMYGGSEFVALTVGGDYRLACYDSGLFRVPGVYDQTVSASTNVHVDSNGYLRRATSSRRYKRDIVPADIDPATVLGLAPVTHRDRAEVARDAITARTYLGLIAEDVDAAGLHWLVTYDGQGRPDALAYDRLAVAQHAVLIDHDARLAALEAALTLGA